jgi:hypothetical protein
MVTGWLGFRITFVRVSIVPCGVSGALMGRIADHRNALCVDISAVADRGPTRLGSQELADQLRSMEHANMSDSAQSFIHALHRDLIGADDFAR